MKIEAMVHSLKGLAEVEIDTLNKTALYNGKLCTTIFNPFVGLWYVDDLYGVIQTK